MPRTWAWCSRRLKWGCPDLPPLPSSRQRSRRSAGRTGTRRRARRPRLERSLLSKETGIDAFLVEWLDKLPHHPADRGDGDARGALDRLTVLAVVIRVTGVDLSELPRTDPVVVHVSPYRRLQIAYDDPQLHRFVEDGLSHCSPPLSR